MKEGPKKSQEEEHLGADKEHYPHAHPLLYFAGVFTLKRRLPGHIPPSLDYSGNNDTQSRPHEPGVIFISIRGETCYKAESPNRACEGPRPRVHEMVRVFRHMLPPQGRPGLIDWKSNVLD